MNSRTDGSPLTASVSVLVTKDGGVQTAGGGTLTHEGNGHWNYAPTQAETDATHVAFTFTHATGVNQTVQTYPVSFDPTDAVGLGLSRLDAAITTRASQASVDALVNAIWDELTAEGRVAGSYGQLLKDFLNAAVASRAVPGDAMDLIVDALDAAAVAATGAAEIADKMLGRSIAGGADGGRTVTSALRRIRNRVAIAAGTMTVYQEDDAATDHTAAVTTTAGDPISQIDPV